MSLEVKVKCVGVLLSDTEFKPKLKNIFFNQATLYASCLLKQAALSFQSSLLCYQNSWGK